MYVNYLNLLCFMQWKKLLLNSAFFNLNAICPFTNPCYLLLFLKLYKLSHFSVQNYDLKFKLEIKLIHLCSFVYKFVNLKLFRERGGGG